MKIIRIRVKPTAIRSERGNRGQVGGSVRTKSRAPRLRGTFFSKLQLRSTCSFPVEPFPRATKLHSVLLVRPLPEFPISLVRMLGSRFLERVKRQAAIRLAPSLSFSRASCCMWPGPLDYHKDYSVASKQRIARSDEILRIILSKPNKCCDKNLRLGLLCCCLYILYNTCFSFYRYSSVLVLFAIIYDFV